MDYKTFIKENTIRVEAGSRGGGIEIDCSKLFGEGTKMTAYQNYLGGGLLGAVQSDSNFKPTAKQLKKFNELTEALKRYFHNLTNQTRDEDWEQSSYEDNQNRPASAY
jgi:hypothetical protein